MMADTSVPPALERLARELSSSARALEASLEDEDLDALQTLLDARVQLLDELRHAVAGLPQEKELQDAVAALFADAMDSDKRLMAGFARERDRVSSDLEQISNQRANLNRLAEGYATTTQGGRLNRTA